MAWVTAALAGASIIGGLIQGNQQREAADAQNEETQAQIDARFERDIKEWSISNLEAYSNYAWNMANTEAQRYQDRVREADYEANQERIIDAALLNLQLNTEALQDTYVTSEELRALEANLNFDKSLGDLQLGLDQTLAGLGISADQSKLSKYQTVKEAKRIYDQGLAAQRRRYNTGIDIENARFAVGKNAAARQKLLTNAELTLDKSLKMAEINTQFAARKASIDSRAAQSNLANMEAVASYMNSIKQRGQQADQIIAQKEAEGQNIQEQIVISEQLDTMQRDAQYITALLEGADTRATSVARGGGSNSAKRAALDSFQKFGRSYGELKALQADRRRALTNYNASLTGETASQMAQIATAIKGEAERIDYTKKANLLQNEGFKLENAQNEMNKKINTISVNATTQYGRNVADSNFDSRLNELRLNKKSNKRQLLDTKRLNIKDIRTNRQFDVGFARQTNQLNLEGIRTRSGLANRGYKKDARYLLAGFNQLTVPGFELARRQGEREFTSLVESTYNEVKGAARPYRNAIIFDPLEPIAGLKPEKGTFTPVAKPSYGQILFNSFLDGASTAMSTSYTDANGNLAFR